MNFTEKEYSERLEEMVKQRTRDLQASESLLKTITQSARDAIIMNDSKGEITFWNPAAVNMFGYSSEEALGRDLHLLLAPQRYHEDYLKGFKKFQSTGEGAAVGRTLELTALHKDGNEFPIEISLSAIHVDDKWHSVGIVRDITQRRKAEEALRESEERYRRVIDNINDVIYSLSPSGELTFISGACEELFGVPAEAIIGRNIYDLASMITVSPEDFQRSNDLFYEAVSKELDSFNFEVSLKKQEGVIHLEIKQRIQYDDTGNVLGSFGVIRDITEHKKAEFALRESEEKYRMLFEGSTNGILIADLETKKFIFANPAICKMLGYSESEILKKDVTDIRPKEVLEQVISEFEAQARGEKSLATNIPCLRNDGKIIYANISSSKVFIGNRGCNVGFFTDVTEHKHLEEQFHQSQKIESIGRLAGGVAHDFNNLLTVITGHADLTLMSLDPENPLCEDLNEIQKAADRASNLTRQLLAFSRKQTLQPKVLNLNQILANFDKMLRRIIGEDIALETIPDPGLWNVRVDPSQIEQVIVNLAVNSRDAMPKGGKLTIETVNIVLDEEYCRTHIDVTPGKYVMLAVSDTGIGMTKEIIEQIFDPFFTTKETGKGTGLGLSTVYGIVKQSNGHIWVYSELGKGTSLKIYLPMVIGEAEEITRKAILDQMPEGNETILVVEDEDAVRDMVIRVLTQQGYQVIEARNGDEAFRLCQESEKPADLIVTDVIMPNMSGKELIERLYKLDLDFKVIYMSGYTANAIVYHGILEADVPYLQKPFRPMDLAIKVREVLDN